MTFNDGLSVSGGINPANNNTFSVFTDQFFAQFDTAINTLIADNGCSVPCTLVFGNCTFIECTNCTNGIYNPDGAVPFANGQLCPLCLGKPHTTVREEECFNFAVTFESRGFRSSRARDPQVMAETFCRVEFYERIRACEYAILDNCNECRWGDRYKPMGLPEPCGLKFKNYILTAWEKV